MTEIIMDGQTLKSLRIHILGENWIWLEGVTEYGTKIHTAHIKMER